MRSLFARREHGLQDRPVACPHLVGRERELSTLSNARRALAQSHASIVLIAGEPGIGKTRLLSDFLRQSGEGRARRLASAECFEHAPRPLGPIRTLLRALDISAASPAAPAHVARALAQLLPDAAEPDAAPLEKSELFGALWTALRSLADERATILSIEDIHWADAATLEFLAFLGPRIGGSRVLIVATYRSDEVDRNDALRGSLAKLSRESNVRRIDLGALGPSDFRSLLLGALDGHPSVPAEALADIEARAEGNPFFGEELLKSALERRGAGSRAGVPLSIRTSILERLKALSDEERRVVSRAAVLGVRFSPNVLAQTLGVELDALLPALRRARDLNIIVEDDTEPARFHFRHALTRQTVYDDLLRIEARTLHRRILETLETGDRGSHLEELAYHAFEARDGERTLLYNERAGDAALALHALAEARTAYDRALEAAREPRDRARLLERVGTIASMQGRVRDALDALDAALASYREILEFDRACDVVRAIVAERNNAGDKSSIDFGVAFLARDGDRVAVPVRDALLAMLARLACIQWDVVRAQALLERIAAPSELPPRARQNELLARMDIAEIAGRAREWQGLVPRLIELLPQLPPFLGLIAHYTIAQSAASFGFNTLADDMFARIDRLERGLDFGAIHAHSAAIRAIDAYLRGKLERAREFVLRGLDGPPVSVGIGALATVAPHVAARLDDPALVTASIEEEIASARRGVAGGDTPDTAAYLGAAAAFALDRGRVHQARSDLKRGIACLRRAAPTSGDLMALAAAHLDRPDLPALERLLELEAYSDEDEACRAHVRLSAAIVAARRGELERSRALASDAAIAYRGLGWPLFEARALETMGDPAGALALYERCGSVADVRRLGSAAPPGGSPGPIAGLSAREREVAVLVAGGLTNGAVGERLSVSKKTVEKHLASVFAKLDVHSRSQLAALLGRAMPQPAPASPPGAAARGG